MIDLSNIKPGDKVTVEAHVFSIEDGKAQIGVARSDRPVTVWVDQVLSHTPAPREIKVGDAVMWPVGASQAIKATVVAIDAGMTMIKDRGEHYTLMPLADLRHYQEPM